jgi:hypothetical protein
VNKGESNPDGRVHHHAVTTGLCPSGEVKCTACHCVLCFLWLFELLSPSSGLCGAAKKKRKSTACPPTKKKKKKKKEREGPVCVLVPDVPAGCTCMCREGRRGHLVSLLSVCGGGERVGGGWGVCMRHHAYTLSGTCLLV